MPILFIVGENDALIDTVSAEQRLNKLIPSAETHLLKDTGHVVFNALEYVLPFLSKEAW